MFNVVPRYDGINDVEKLKSMSVDNKEGFVVRFSNGFRMKVKFEEYCRLHSIVTNVSNKIIWEYLKDNRSFEELLDRVPDEFYSWVEKTKKGLIDAYTEIERQAMADYIFINNKYVLKDIYEGISKEELKKRFALGVKKCAEKDTSIRSGILFSMWDNKDYSQTIWKLVKPSYEKPFKDGVDDN
jgi:RNA ligase